MLYFIQLEPAPLKQHPSDTRLLPPVLHTHLILHPRDEAPCRRWRYPKTQTCDVLINLYSLIYTDHCETLRETFTLRAHDGWKVFN